MNALSSNPVNGLVASVEDVKNGQQNLVAGTTIVFSNNKEATLKKPEGYTFATSGCLKYYHPDYQKNCYIKVENSRLLNHVGADVVGVSHFVLPEEVAV